MAQEGILQSVVVLENTSRVRDIKEIQSWEEHEERCTKQNVEKNSEVLAFCGVSNVDCRGENQLKVAGLKDPFGTLVKSCFGELCFRQYVPQVERACTKFPEKY